MSEMNEENIMTPSPSEVANGEAVAKEEAPVGEKTDSPQDMPQRTGVGEADEAFIAEVEWVKNLAASRGYKVHFDEMMKECEATSRSDVDTAILKTRREEGHIFLFEDRPASLRREFRQTGLYSLTIDGDNGFGLTPLGLYRMGPESDGEPGTNYHWLTYTYGGEDDEAKYKVVLTLMPDKKGVEYYEYLLGQREKGYVGTYGGEAPGFYTTVDFAEVLKLIGDEVDAEKKDAVFFKEIRRAWKAIIKYVWEAYEEDKKDGTAYGEGYNPPMKELWNNEYIEGWIDAVKNVGAQEGFYNEMWWDRKKA